MNTFKNELRQIVCLESLDEMKVRLGSIVMKMEEGVYHCMDREYLRDYVIKAKFRDAIDYGDLEVVHRMLRLTPWVFWLILDEHTGKSAIHIAVESADVDMLNFLLLPRRVLKEEFDVREYRENVVDLRTLSCDSTPLHLAINLGYEIMAARLLNCGADPCAENGEGQTPFILACVEGYDGIVKMIIKASGGRCLEERDCDGQTGLHLSVDYNHHQIASLLLKFKPDLVFAENDDGFTPLDLARKYDMPFFIELMERYAKPSASRAKKQKVDNHS